MPKFIHTAYGGRTALTVAVLMVHTAICGAQVTVARPRIAAPPPIQMASPPAAASVMEASTRALQLASRPPILDAQVTTLIQTINGACFAPNPTFKPHGLLPASFSSSNTTPYPQASWSPPRRDLNYVIQRAVIGTANWSTVASTCGGTPSIWFGIDLNSYTRDPLVTFADSSGGLQPGTTYVYKVVAIDPQNETDWASFQWTSQPQLPTIQVSHYQHVGKTISFTAAQFYDIAGQVVDSAQQLVVKQEGAAAFALSLGSVPQCQRGSYGIVCPVQILAATGKQTGVQLTLQWGFYQQGGLHVYAQSGISLPTP
jgi:hypothetical protein